MLYRVQSKEHARKTGDECDLATTKAVLHTLTSKFAFGALVPHATTEEHDSAKVIHIAAIAYKSTVLQLHAMDCPPFLYHKLWQNRRDCSKGKVKLCS